MGIGRRQAVDANLNSIEAVAAWCQAVQAAIPVPMALRKIADRVGADLAAIVRVDHSEKNPGNNPPADSGAGHTKIVAFDRLTNLADDIVGFRVSYAEAVCGEYLTSAKPGSIWHARRSDFDHILRLHAPLLQRRLIETVVIPLEHHVTSSDFLELHFAHELAASILDRFSLIAPTLAEGWKTRAFGILHQNSLAMQSAATGATSPESRAPILGMDNSFGLSRSEYRVCLLLSRGLNNNSLLDELSIGRSTLRTHLRNIYAKTSTASEVELVQRLLVPAAPPSIHAANANVA